ncbi:T9SS type A sorting domain-containing protein [Wenyingzhuangia sp. 2_MG-2023]|uniref:T9SS type A sorting domain-containing protein n=1 Tax=Wenyingzhuangia sp. 2_MG-2023 TaxID=3062639 RepID=UPI0026E4718F|nr:T9SS type A sorting domain-containing protein [Wenyingzhuangia sp. 2_MG-2023]MDO6738841.1 T9SS type A sorting domain-containing protein [Wenyingzhuangia sp. 2_MG-2023]
MKRITMLLLALSAKIMFSQTVPTFGSGLDPKPSGKVWVKEDGLTDEFNVNGLDTSKWSKSTWNYDVPVEMVADNTNSGVWGGYLWIRATLDQGAERWFRTARIMSKEQISYPMYTESRIKASSISAFNTFWLNNGDSNNRDEIDVIENNAAPTCDCKPDYPWLMKSHYWQARNGTEYDEASDFDNRNLPAGTPGKGVKWDADYHVFGVYWKDARNMDFYLNGVKVGSLVSDFDYTRDLNILWDLWAKDANWIGGLPAQSDLNNNAINTMYVDWVRTWTLADDPNSVNYFLMNRETGSKVRTNGISENTPLELVPSSWSGAPTQWEKVATDNGWFYLKNIANGMYFRPTDDTENSVLVQKPTSYNGSYTQWKMVESSGGYFYLQNRETGDYFRPETSDNYSNIIQKSTASNGTWTQWALIPTGNNSSVMLEQNFVVEKQAQASMQIYPNPLKEEDLTIRMGNEDTTSYTLVISDVKGSIVFNNTVTGTTVISKEILKKSGLYFVKAVNESQKIVKKIMVE